MSDEIDNIVRVLEFKQPILRVWQAISDPKELSIWFGSNAQFDLIEGSQGYFEWQKECEGRFSIKLITINAPHYFSWRWMLKKDTPFSLTSSTLVEWKLEEIPQGTKLTLMESGFASAKHHQMNNEGWQQELSDLTSFLSS